METQDKPQEKTWLLNNWKSIRITLLVIFLIGFAISLIVYFYVQLQISIEGLPAFDWGGVMTLFLTTFVVLLFNFPYSLEDSIKEAKGTKLVILLLIVIIGIIGIWLAIRAIGIFVVRYTLMEAETYFQASDVFSLLSYVVAANLPFTLLKAMSVNQFMQKKQKTTDKSKPEKEVIIGLLDVVIQVILIGFITYLPNYANITFLGLVNGYVGYVTILSVLLVAFLILIIARGQLKSQN